MTMAENIVTMPPEVMELYSFPLPDAEEARFILRELEWGEHFVGIEMNPAAGNRDIYIYSLKEASRFLRYGTAGMGLSTGGKGSISWFDIDKLVAWLRNDVRDPDLADAIARDTAGEESYHGKVQKLGSLIDMRLAQLSDLVATVEQ